VGGKRAIEQIRHKQCQGVVLLVVVVVVARQCT
jgi:hypothetical protein